MFSAHILIVLSLATMPGYATHTRIDKRATNVVMQRFETLSACRSAAQEIARQNNGHGELRMSCIPVDKKETP